MQGDQADGNWDRSGKEEHPCNWKIFQREKRGKRVKPLTMMATIVEEEYNKDITIPEEETKARI